MAAISSSASEFYITVDCAFGVDGEHAIRAVTAEAMKMSETQKLILIG